MERYVHLPPLEHFLLRPQRDVGSIQATNEPHWALVNGKAERSTIVYCEALKKMFDEVIQNACDNAAPTRPDPRTRNIGVQLCPDHFIVINDGSTIPIEVHPEWNGKYIAEGLFTLFGSSENFNDSVDRQGAGMNGLGVKLVSALSSKLEVVCRNGQKEYTQTFENNLRTVTPPVIKNCPKKAGTMITCYPDFTRFKDMVSLESMLPVLHLSMRRVAAFFPHIHFRVNSEDVVYKQLSTYATLWTSNKVVTRTVLVGNEEMRYGYTLTTTDVYSYDACVNGIDTPDGGTHVDKLTNLLIDAFVAKTKVVSRALIKSRLHVICFLRTTRPEFNAQIKTRLTSKLDAGLTTALEHDIELVMKRKDETGITEDVVQRRDALSKTSLNKSLGGDNLKRKVLVDDLLDAKCAGKKGREQCALFITEGKSALTMCAEGFGEVGNEYFGAMPIRGKITNVHGLAITGVVEKITTVSDIARALGLRAGSKPGDETLRYGRVVLMTDQDSHGAHISGLLLTLFYTFWPELLRAGFVWKFITPVVKAFKGTHELASFFDEATFADWAQHYKGSYETRFYKGLGSADPVEGRSYFANLDKHLKRVVFDDAGKEAIELFFDKKRANNRKTWMELPVLAIDYAKPQIDTREFVESELRSFALSQVQSMIPGLTDGLKPVHRKILFIAREHPNDELKIPSLSGLLVAKAAYHHGETSAHDCISGLAACYPSSNNLAFFNGHGGTGSRLGGKATEKKEKKEKKKRAPHPRNDYKVGNDAAQARYVSVSLVKTCAKMIRKEDDDSLEYMVVDGKTAEPRCYSPVLPIGLINGAESIASGHASCFQGHDPMQILQAVRARTQGTPFVRLPPAYCGFTGSFKQSKKDDETGGWDCIGVFTLHDDECTVTEIPVGFSILGYKAFLDALEHEGKIKGVQNDSTSNKARFTFSIVPPFEPTIKSLCLVDHVQTQYKFLNTTGAIVQYSCIEEALEAWYQCRLAFVTQRLERITPILQRNVEEQKARLLMLPVVASLDLRLPRGTLITKLVAAGFDEAVSSKMLSSLRVTSLSEEGMQDENTELETRMQTLKDHLQKTPMQVMMREMDELEPLMREQLAKTEQRNFMQRVESKKKKR